jgi:hypothetical protein
MVIWFCSKDPFFPGGYSTNARQARSFPSAQRADNPVYNAIHLMRGATARVANPGNSLDGISFFHLPKH